MKQQTRKTLLSLAFACAAFPAAAMQNVPVDEVTYWKTSTFDAVIALKKCPQQGVCGELYWVNPEDTRIFDYFADPKEKAKKAQDMFGNQPDITQDDVRSLCGFQPKMHFREVAPNKWRGVLDMRGMGFEVDTDVTVLNEKEIRVTTSKFLFRSEETWKRVDAGDPQYPKCERPLKR